jgi:hypothetical protein
MFRCSIISPVLRLCVVAAWPVAGLIAALFWPASRAEACFYRPDCKPLVLPAEGATLPANYTTIAIQRCLEATSIDFSVERDGASTPVDFDEEPAKGDWRFMGMTLKVPLRWNMLILRSQLRAGDTLVLRYLTDRVEDLGLHEIEVRWPVVEAEELPAQLGTLDVRNIQGVVTVSANVSCLRDMTSSYADISLHASAEAKPWLPRIRYELRVDDVPWLYFDSLQDQHTTGSWHSTLGPRNDRIVLGCEVEPHMPVINDSYVAAQALEPGSHRVRMVGFLASGEELSSEEVMVDLQCAPDSARALKAELDALKASRADAQRIDEPAADSGDADAGCAAVSSGSTRASGWPAALLAVCCLARLVQGTRARSNRDRRA